MVCCGAVAAAAAASRPRARCRGGCRARPRRRAAARAPARRRSAAGRGRRRRAAAHRARRRARRPTPLHLQHRGDLLGRKQRRRRPWRDQLGDAARDRLRQLAVELAARLGGAHAARSGSIGSCCGGAGSSDAASSLRGPASRRRSTVANASAWVARVCWRLDVLLPRPLDPPQHGAAVVGVVDRLVREPPPAVGGDERRQQRVDGGQRGVAGVVVARVAGQQPAQLAERLRPGRHADPLGLLDRRDDLGDGGDERRAVADQHVQRSLDVGGRERLQQDEVGGGAGVVPLALPAVLQHDGDQLPLTRRHGSRSFQRLDDGGGAQQLGEGGGGAGAAGGAALDDRRRAGRWRRPSALGVDRGREAVEVAPQRLGGEHVRSPEAVSVDPVDDLLDLLGRPAVEPHQAVHRDVPSARRQQPARAAGLVGAGAGEVGLQPAEGINVVVEGDGGAGRRPMTRVSASSRPSCPLGEQDWATSGQAWSQLTSLRLRRAALWVGGSGCSRSAC